MKTSLGEKYDLNYAGIPPGMSRKDHELWVNYRETIDKTCISIHFNVYLGSGASAGDLFSMKWQDYWRKLTQLRADVVIELRHCVEVIEFRHNAEVDVIGSLMTYMHCLEKDNPFAKPIKGELVTNLYASEVETMCEIYKLKYTII